MSDAVFLVFLPRRVFLELVDAANSGLYADSEGINSCEEIVGSLILRFLEHHRSAMQAVDVFAVADAERAVQEGRDEV